MATFLLRRLGLMVLTLWILSLIVFFAGEVLPGDAGRAILGNLASQSAVQALDHQLRVDRPLITQYLGWIGGLLHGNLGESYTYQAAVEPFVRAALINSLKLAVLAFVIVVPATPLVWHRRRSARSAPARSQIRKLLINDSWRGRLHDRGHYPLLTGLSVHDPGRQAEGVQVRSS